MKFVRRRLHKGAFVEKAPQQRLQTHEGERAWWRIGGMLGFESTQVSEVVKFLAPSYSMALNIGNGDLHVASWFF
jgi:hypothetical protein